MDRPSYCIFIFLIWSQAIEVESQNTDYGQLNYISSRASSMPLRMQYDSLLHTPQNITYGGSPQNKDEPSMTARRKKLTQDPD